MEQMNYSSNCKKILDRGNYKGYDYLVMSYGTHPCAYVKLPKNTADDIINKIRCHGGITYDKLGDDCRVIGWDYAHCNDFDGVELDFLSPLEIMQTHHKMWTTEDISGQCRDIINQIISLC